uniref:THUMP domain-containing protein n=1 Tax=Palpitomonas bilix TaxID=652834 RepID=A0A7S3FZW6_9EUKA|mmetsp:Transcript_1737/g.3651  ORF Transcript_1737/g.3651 Transcript_1737/m.3651 type:complete len:187 (+) Transcript_1737:331-891(+)
MKRSEPDTRMCVEGLTPGLFFHISSGFEPAAEIEISKKLGEYGAKHVKTQRGKLHFSLAVNHTVTPHVLQSVLGCEGAFVAVANVAGVSADEKCLEDFEKLPLVIGKEQWQAALKLWRFLHSQDEKDPKKLFPSTFRVTVKRGGKHNWKSIDAAGIVGSGMLSDDFKKMTGLDLTVNLKNFDLEVS